MEVKTFCETLDKFDVEGEFIDTIGSHVFGEEVGDE